MDHTKRRYRYHIQCRICGRQFRNLGWSHLRVHRTTTEAYKRKYRVDYVYSDDLRNRISEGKTTKTRRSRYRPRSKKEILRALRRYAKDAESPSCPDLERKDVNLVKQALYAFGSWYEALRAAGLSPRRFRRWSKENVVEGIGRRARKGLPLQLSAVQRDDPHLYGAARNHLGSWRRAVEASGIDYSGVTKKKDRSREAVTRDLRAWAGRRGRLDAASLRKSDRALTEAVYRRFGSLERAARLLRLPYASRVQRWSVEEILRQARARMRSGKSLQARHVILENSCLYQAARKYLGSWPAAVGRLGIDYSRIDRHKTRTRETIGRDLRAWNRRHGPVSCGRLGRTDRALLAATYRVIGSPAAAARLFGLPCGILRGAREKR